MAEVRSNREHFLDYEGAALAGCVGDMKGAEKCICQKLPLSQCKDVCFVFQAVYPVTKLNCTNLHVQLHPSTQDALTAEQYGQAVDSAHYQSPGRDDINDMPPTILLSA